MFTCTCASRHNGVHFLDMSIPKSAPELKCFAHFHFQMCFVPQLLAPFGHLNLLLKDDVDYVDVNCEDDDNGYDVEDVDVDDDVDDDNGYDVDDVDDVDVDDGDVDDGDVDNVDVDDVK